MASPHNNNNQRAHSSPDSDLPKRIGRYVAFQQIGAGGMARVYLGTRRTTVGDNDLVVIKQLRRDVAEDDQVLNLFVDEARIAMQLDHKNVVKTREVVAEPPDYHLVMEFLDGQSLLHVLKRVGWKGVPRDAHIWILTQVLAGLEYAHDLKDAQGKKLGIVHRDVSPSNVLVCYTGDVKLLDFGIAKASGALAATHQGVVKGKVGYAAPEQCLGKAADPRSDLFSVGVMLWEAVAGRRRSSGETQLAILQGRLEDTEPPLEKVCPDAHPTLVRVTRRALARAPEMRYQTAREFRVALEQYLNAQPQRMGAQDVAAVLRQHFEPDRAVLRTLIETHGRMTAVSGTQPRVQVPSSAPPLQALPAVDVLGPEEFDFVTTPNDEDTSPIPVDEALLRSSRRGDSMRPGSSMPPRGSVQPIAPLAPVSIGFPQPHNTPYPEPKKSRAWLGFAAGIAVAGAAAAGFLLRGSPDKTAAPEPASAAATGTPAAAAPAATTGAPAAAAATGEKIKLRISVDPKDAEVRLDGRLLKSNPYGGEVPKDGAEHELTVTADKYRSEKHMLRFDDDIDLELELESTTSRRVRRAQIIRGGRAPVALPATAEPARPTAAAPAKIEPGMDLEMSRPANPRGKTKIDEKDPYAK